MIRIVHAYPDLMNIYGDYANIALLQKRLECAGHTVLVTHFSVTEEISLSGCDLLYFGAGTEKAMVAALRDLAEHAGEISSFAAFGGCVLATGNAMALLGNRVVAQDGEVLEGLALLDYESAVQPGRRYAEYILSTTLTAQPIVGAVNTSLAVSGDARPLFSVEACTEKQRDPAVALGAIWRNVCATQLCGPLLVRNPALLDAYAMLLTRDAVAPCEADWYRYAAAGYASALATLKKETGR